MNAKQLQINQWLVDLESGELFELVDPGLAVGRFEPQGITLLKRLADQPHHLVDKDALIAHIWPHAVVTDDALTRCVSRVRKLLNDNPKQPRIIETLPKRGYRLIASDIVFQDTVEDMPNSQREQAVKEEQLTFTAPSPRRGFAFRTPFTKKLGYLMGLFPVIILVALAYWWTLASDTPLPDQAQDFINKGDDYYHQIRRQDNEMAIAMYERAISLKPDNAAGQAGLANALVQQVIRWPGPANDKTIVPLDLSDAITGGRTRTPEAILKLDRAFNLARVAVRAQPDNPKAHKALGFVYSAQEKFELALTSYQEALVLNPDAWDVLINMGDVLEISGRLPQAIGFYEQAFAAMGRVYDTQGARVQPWYAQMGATVADKHMLLDNVQEAEVWYRHTLSLAPFHAGATRGLANILRRSGEGEAARRLCSTFVEKIGDDPCIHE